jgi:hypothetical protein
LTKLKKKTDSPSKTNGNRQLKNKKLKNKKEQSRREMSGIEHEKIFKKYAIKFLLHHHFWRILSRSDRRDKKCNGKLPSICSTGTKDNGTDRPEECREPPSSPGPGTRLTSLQPF